MTKFEYLSGWCVCHFTIDIIIDTPSLPLTSNVRDSDCKIAHIKCPEEFGGLDWNIFGINSGSRDKRIPVLFLY